MLAEDAASIGIMGTIKPVATLAGAISLTPDAVTPLPDAGLASPIEVFFNQMPVTRGKTVLSEVIGSGNPVVAGQDLTLQQSPVTYFLDPASISGNGFSSTVRVRVNGVLWKEVRSFFNQAANAPVFVLREDDQGQTHVMFGDGVNGALLPTGANNVVATYRYGAGEPAPARRNPHRRADPAARPKRGAQPAATNRRRRSRSARETAQARASLGADLQSRGVDR